MLLLLFTRLLPRWVLLCGLTVAALSVAHAQVPTEPLSHRQDATASFGLPFKLMGRLIILPQLSLNGQWGDFILDTSNAMALLIERSAFPSQLLAATRHPTAHGNTGTVAPQKLPVTSFHLGPARYTGFTAHALPPTAAITVPFELVAGVIVLRNVVLNGQRGDFVLDTGCTYALVVEQTAFPKSQLRLSAKRGLGAAGSVPLYELPITQFALGTLHDHPPVALATSLAPIRAVVGPRLLGLLGTGLLRQYEVVLDYAHHRLSLYPLNAAASLARPFTRHDSVAFTLEKGWPIVTAFIDSAPVQLLLDTGARDSSLDADFAHNLRVGTRPTGTQRETILAPGGKVAARRATLPALQVGSTEWRNLPLIVASPVHYQSGRALPYQGVLGESFLSQEPLVSFHFGRRQFYSLTPKQP